MSDAETGAPTAPTGPTEPDWHRLSARVIWVDLARSLVSLVPAVVAVTVFDVALTWGAMWPFALVAGWGTLGAVADAVRWAFTRYRVTPDTVERRTGLLVKRHRSIQRDRIRSVDTTALLRHRLGGLRVVTVGAGQQTGASESALVLDALGRDDAAHLQAELLATAPAGAVQASTADGEEVAPEVAVAADGAASDGESAAPAAEQPEPEVLARIRPWWVVYNMVGIWGYVSAAGLLWGAYWMADLFGVDLLAGASYVVGWAQLATPARVVLVVAAGTLVGVVALGVAFATGYWRFELARVRSAGTTSLRTRRGLLSTREVNRDEARVRGLSIGEPLLWRWMRMADTNVITTGLSIWDTAEPSAILPRGPRAVALDVAERVLGTPSPFAAPLRRHPRVALRRRLVWATLVIAAALAVLVPPVLADVVPTWALAVPLALWPVALLLGWVSYRALGHTVAGDYLVVRSGTLSRTTSALRTDAVSTIAVRQSFLQRRLGLSTVSAMTAAGWWTYQALDVDADEALDLAAAAAPGVLDDVLVRTRE